jgi:hypothetical protein
MILNRKTTLIFYQIKTETIILHIKVSQDSLKIQSVRN